MGTKPTSVGIGKGRDPEALKHRLTDRPTMLRPSTMLAGACLALLSSCAPTLLPARPPIAEPPVKPTSEERVARPTIAERAASRDVMIGLQQQPTPRPSSTVPTGGDYQDGYPLLVPAPKARAAARDLQGLFVDRSRQGRDCRCTHRGAACFRQLLYRDSAMGSLCRSDIAAARAAVRLSVADDARSRRLDHDHTLCERVCARLARCPCLHPVGQINDGVKSAP